MSKINKEFKEKLIACYMKGGDFMNLADSLDIKRKSARSIIYRFSKSLHTGKHGGHKPKTITDEIGEELLDFVAEKPTATIAGIRQFILHRHETMRISNTCISDFLDGKLITHKRVKNVPTERNSIRVKELREKYARWYIETGFVSSELIYIDEVGVNVWTKRNYGRSKKGDRCFQVVNRLRGENITICAATSKTGVFLVFLKRI